MGILCMWGICFSLPVFKILPLSLILDSFIIMCLGEYLFELSWQPMGFMNLGIQISPQIWKVLSHYFFFPRFIEVELAFNIELVIIIFLNKLSAPFSHSSPSGTPKMCKLLFLMLSQNSCGLSSLFFILFSLLSSDWIQAYLILLCFIYCTSHICIVQVYQCHFSNCIYSLHVSVVNLTIFQTIIIIITIII